MKLLSAFLCLFVLASCGGKSKNKNIPSTKMNPVVDTLDESKIVGTWESDCIYGNSNKKVIVNFTQEAKFVQITKSYHPAKIGCLDTDAAGAPEVRELSFKVLNGHGNNVYGLELTNDNNEVLNYAIRLNSDSSLQVSNEIEDNSLVISFANSERLSKVSAE